MRFWIVLLPNTASALRLCQFTDLHLSSSFPDTTATTLDRIASAVCDWVVCTGDIVHEHDPHAGVLARRLAAAVGERNWTMVRGNHDAEWSKVQQAAEQSSTYVKAETVSIVPGVRARFDDGVYAPLPIPDNDGAQLWFTHVPPHVAKEAVRYKLGTDCEEMSVRRPSQSLSAALHAATSPIWYFFGHDHLNDWCGSLTEHVRMCYGRVSGGFPHYPKPWFPLGYRVVDLDAEGRIDTWVEVAGVRIEAQPVWYGWWTCKALHPPEWMEYPYDELATLERVKGYVVLALILVASALVTSMAS